jgi:hypothetical protein
MSMGIAVLSTEDRTNLEDTVKVTRDGHLLV